MLVATVEKPMTFNGRETNAVLRGELLPPLATALTKGQQILHPPRLPIKGTWFGIGSPNPCLETNFSST